MSDRAGFRPDLEGLRAAAVLLVLLYHARVPFVDGRYVGVDVFFVPSGFLITGIIVGELIGTGRIGLAAFYARRARRLLREWLSLPPEARIALYHGGFQLNRGLKIELPAPETSAFRRRCFRAARERWNWESGRARLVALYGGLAAEAPL